MDYEYDEAARPVTFDARSLRLPAAAIISIVLAFSYGTYTIVNEKNTLDKRIDNVIKAVERLADSVEKTNEGIQYRAQDRWTASDHALWCYEAEKINKGFQCPKVSPRLAPQPLVPPGLRDDITKGLRGDER